MAQPQPRYGGLLDDILISESWRLRGGLRSLGEDDQDDSDDAEQTKRELLADGTIHHMHGSVPAAPTGRPPQNPSSGISLAAGTTLTMGRDGVWIRQTPQFSGTVSVSDVQH